MKKFTKTLAVLLALLIAFGVAASAAFPPPEELDALPELTLGVATAGSVAMASAWPDYPEYINGEAWFQFKPAQSGYYLLFTTGNYNNGPQDNCYVNAAFFTDAETYLYLPYELSEGKTYYVNVSAGGIGIEGERDFTVTVKLYTYAEPLQYKKSTSSSLEDILKGSDYSAADVEYTFESGGKRHIYFSDGVYTVVEIGRLTLPEIYEREGLFGAVKEVVTWLGMVPLASPMLFFLGCFFFWTFAAPMVLIPLSIVVLPVSLLFLPFSLLSLILNLF